MFCRTSRAVLAAGWFATGLLLVSGCGGSRGPTTGRVLFDDGTPVQSGSIEFRERDSEDRFASRIERDGAFTPTSTDGQTGLPPGDYDVVVVQIILTEDLALAAHQHGGTVQRKYADYYTSGLRIQIEPDDTDPIEIVVAATDDNE